MSEFAVNPELLRNARIQLRPGRAIAAAVICAAISLTAWSYSSYDSTEGSTGLLRLTLQLQVLVLLLGGGIACLQSVHREKELNTFDYQRVTRLTSLELALGKLFGAPILTYFVVLCLIPLAIFAAVLGRVGTLLVVEAYIVLLLGCIAYHSLALLASMVLGRGGTAMVIFGFLILVALTSSETGRGESNWLLGQFSPFAAASFSIWSPGMPPWRDMFFGRTIWHFATLLVLYATFTGWFLLGIKRNLKRDPATYEIYSPLQGFCFAMYLNILLLGFFNWQSSPGTAFINDSRVPKEQAGLPATSIEQSLLLSSAWIFFVLGILLLRNRERARRRVHALSGSAAGWWASVWPTPYVLAGILLAGLAIVELIRIYRQPGQDWSYPGALFEVAFCAAWVARDVLYLQWMNLRRTRRPLVSAFLYLVIFYTCAGIMLTVTEKLVSERAIAVSALLVPSQLLPRMVAMWPANHGLLAGILVSLAAEAFGFAFLQRKKLHEFVAPAISAPAPTAKNSHHTTILSSS